MKQLDFHFLHHGQQNKTKYSCTNKIVIHNLYRLMHQIIDAHGMIMAPVFILTNPFTIAKYLSIIVIFNLDGHDITGKKEHTLSST